MVTYGVTYSGHSPRLVPDANSHREGTGVQGPALPCSCRATDKGVSLYHFHTPLVGRSQGLS